MIQQVFYLPGGILLRQSLQPHNEFVLVQAKGDGRAARLFSEYPAFFQNHTANRFQNHITKHNSVFFVHVFEIVQEQIRHDALGLFSAGLGQKLHACAEYIETGDVIRHVLAELFRFPLLLLLDIANASHQLPAPPVRIIDGLSRKGHPVKLRLPGPPQAELRIGIIRILLYRRLYSFPVRLINIVQINVPVLRSMTLPLPVHGVMVDQVKAVILHIIGKKDVFGGFESHLIAFLLFQKNVFRLLLLFCQIADYLIERIDFQNIGWLKPFKAGASFHDALHQMLNRTGQMAHQNIDPEDAEDQTDQDGDNHPKIELTAHAKQLLFRIQSKQHPIGVFIGHVFPV